MSKLRVLDLFSGIGGFSLGLERAKHDGEIDGFETVAFCEIEEFPRKVLAKWWPEVPCYRDVRELTAERLAADGIAVDVITGGFPCQDISAAAFAHGRAGVDGERSGLFREALRLADKLAPSWIIFENVTGLLTEGLVVVLQGLCEIGYDAEWHCIPASALGSAQARDRIWIVAYPTQERNTGPLEGLRPSEVGQGRQGSAPYLQFVSNAPFEPRDCWPQPLIRRVDDWHPDWVDRIAALGNAVVPQIPELIGNAILQAINEGEA